MSQAHLWSSRFGWFFAALACGPVSAGALDVEATIPLGDVAGRIDHLAADVAHKRLFIAELGSDRIAVVDVGQRTVLRTIDGLREPQGVAYEPSTDTLYVANGGDGSVRLYSGATFEPSGTVDLHDDADNVRIDAAHRRLLVGYGDGLAAIDIATRGVRTFPLGGHPEAFQIDPATSRVIVNVPRLHAVVALDTTGHVQRRAVPLPGANFPLAIDDLGRLVLPLRHPAALLVMSALSSGADRDPTSPTDRERASSPAPASTSSELCDDADDVFVDAGRQRLYVSCGDGHLDVFDRTDSAYVRSDHLPTAPGARTSLFVAEWDRLYLAVPASASAPAALWIMEPN
jgi:YVTN family beta-propeller protein